MSPSSDLEDLRPLLDTAAPAALLTYRADGSANMSPVWAEMSGSFVAARGPGVVVRLPTSAARVWDLADIIPATR